MLVDRQRRYRQLPESFVDRIVVPFYPNRQMVHESLRREEAGVGHHCPLDRPVDWVAKLPMQM